MKLSRWITQRAAWIAACILLIPACALSQLIEPTRTLGETAETPGSLAVYSEPPELPVKLNGIPVGKTPLVDPAVEPGLYVVAVNEKEMQVRITSRTAVRLSYFKGDFFILPEKKTESIKELNASAEKREPRATMSPQTSRDLEYAPFYWPLNPQGPIY
jgi:hypothetical protein